MPEQFQTWRPGQASDDRLALLAEVDRLRSDLAEARKIAAGLAGRVAAQSQLLSKRAEKPRCVAHTNSDDYLAYPCGIAGCPRCDASEESRP